jgi:phosphatidate cytidylyltransferase
VAFNIPVLKTRALTALIFVAIMISGLLINAYTFLALFLIILSGCLLEFFKIIKIIFPVRYAFYFPAALLYILMPVIMMLDLSGLFDFSAGGHSLVYDPLIPCGLIFSIWINDTMAYLVGSWIGRTPFSPISPKKTWEGTIGGVILCVVIISLLGKLPVASRISQIQWSVIATLAGIFGTMGDLFESKLKRMAGIKDSGRIMPGHGGFLDRFDSLLVATPFVWIYVRAFV